MTHLLKQLKSLGLVAIAAIFLFSATLSACGDKKKENSDNTEMENDTTATEHPSDSESHEEHPANDEEGEEHPTNEEGEEHPAN